MNFLKRLFSNDDYIDLSEHYSIKSIQKFVEDNIDLLNNSSIDDLGKSFDEIVSARKRKELFKKQLSLCGLGDLSSKMFIKSWITDLITQKYGVNDENIDYAINFDFPSTYDKFCIILNKYKNKYGYDALKKLINENGIDKLKDFHGEKMYAFTSDDVDRIYESNIYGCSEKISFEEKLDILVQRVYESSHGLSVIDEIRDQRCDGISLGVSGIPIDFISKINDTNIKNNEYKNYPISYDSIWLYYEGKEISMEFLSFGSQRELERICKKVYKFNRHKQFTKSDGYIFNNMADFSRISVFRPPYSEGWAAFIRKFDIDGNLNELVVGDNSEFVRDLIMYIVRGKQNICLSGQQGVGKTTMLVGIVKKMYGNVTLRIWESFFETFLRFKMPYRNIFTLREMDEIDGEKALDSLKKTNGQITIISEAAEDRMKAYIVKGALEAAEAVMWTGHSETPDDLVQTLRNACINVGIFKDEIRAEEQVLSILDWDIHLRKEADGYRHIERITEFVRVNNDEYSEDNDQQTFYSNATKYFKKKTNSEMYKAINIIEYDKLKKKYVVKNNISDKRIKRILDNLRDDDLQGFNDFIKKLKGEVIVE